MVNCENVMCDIDYFFVQVIEPFDLFMPMPDGFRREMPSTSPV